MISCWHGVRSTRMCVERTVRRAHGATNAPARFFFFSLESTDSLNSTALSSKHSSPAPQTHSLTQPPTHTHTPESRTAVDLPARTSPRTYRRTQTLPQRTARCTWGKEAQHSFNHMMSMHSSPVVRSCNTAINRQLPAVWVGKINDTVNVCTESNSTIALQGLNNAVSYTHLTLPTNREV